MHTWRQQGYKHGSAWPYVSVFIFIFSIWMYKPKRIPTNKDGICLEIKLYWRARSLDAAVHFQRINILFVCRLRCGTHTMYHSISSNSAQSKSYSTQSNTNHDWYLMKDVNIQGECGDYSTSFPQWASKWINKDVSKQAKMKKVSIKAYYVCIDKHLHSICSRHVRKCKDMTVFTGGLTPSVDSYLKQPSIWNINCNTKVC